MTYSLFNSIIPLNEGYDFIYNAYQDQFILLKKEQAKRLMERKLGLLPAPLLQQLTDAGMLVDPKLDELQLLEELNQEAINDEKVFSVIINPTMSCNFDCWYCYETKGKGQKMSEETIAHIKALFLKQAHQNPKLEHINISFFGGEPLLYFEQTVVPILDFMPAFVAEKKLTYNVSFSSNGFLLNEDRVAYLINRNVTSFQITLDGQKEDHDKTRFVSKTKGSYDQIIENVKGLLTNGVSVTLRINYTPENIEGIHHILDEFAEIKSQEKDLLHINYQAVWQTVDRTAEQETLVNTTLEKTKNKAKAFGLDNFEGGGYYMDLVRNPCYADRRDSVVINYNGDLYNCTARDFLKANREGYLSDEGALVWNDELLEKRMNIKFQNKACQTCRIAPVCGGGCSQKIMEHQGTDFCMLNYNEKEKNERIMERFEALVLNQDPDHLTHV